MPKRSRSPDPASAELIENIKRHDELEDIETRFNNEKAAIEHDNELALEDIRKEFDTLDPDVLEGRAQLRLKQKLEFQKGLYSDRLKNMEKERLEEREKHQKTEERRGTMM